MELGAFVVEIFGDALWYIAAAVTSFYIAAFVVVAMYSLLSSRIERG